MSVPIAVADAAGVVIIAGLFRLAGPVRAAAAGVVGGLLFLPRGTVMAGPFPFDKRTATGLGLALGMLLFDRKVLAATRPRWVDLPMVAMALAPLTGLLVGGTGSSADVVDQVCQRVFGYLLPYAVGRFYLADRDGPRRVGVAIAVGGLCYIPVCIYEELAGPGRYLAGLIYGTASNPGMVNRLGGYRPEGFLEQGLEVSGWMALATVTAAWLWAGRAWPAAGRASWVPALALLLTTLSCRGVYGYIALALGLATLAATRCFRTRIFLILLALLPASYMAARASGAWDGKILDDLARRAGRGNTVAVRLQAEDDVIARVLARGPAFGLGSYPWHGDLRTMLDGQWVQQLYSGGIVGLVVHFSAMHLVPAILALARPRARPTALEATRPEWGLVAFGLLQLVDSIHNNMLLPPTALIAGSLAGRSLTGASKRAAAERVRPPGGEVQRGRFWPFLAIVAILAILGLLGRRTRGDVIVPPSRPPGMHSPMPAQLPGAPNQSLPPRIAT